MARVQISLVGILFVVLFIETIIVPELWSTLRVDLLIGMCIGVIIHLSFSQGLIFMMISSLTLQAFSGARPGFLPLLYLFGYLVLDLLKNVIYMENVLTQVLLAASFNVLMVAAYAVSMNMVVLGEAEMWPLFTGSLITGVLSPFMVAMVSHLKKAYDA
jgi:hypothetical protein